MTMSVNEAEAYLIANRDAPFVELVRQVGLDPATHFRYADLSEVDFSGQNLSEFDFTGSTLLGCNFTRSTLGQVILDGARFDRTALFLAADFDAEFGFQDVEMDKSLVRSFLSDRRWRPGLGGKLIKSSGLVSALVVLRRYLEKSRDIAAAQIGEMADAMTPEDAFYLAESAALRLRQDLVRWGRGHCRSLDDAADRFQKLVIPAKENARIFLDSLLGVASGIEFFGVLAIAGRLGVATNAVRSHELLARLDGPRWDSPPLATADWTWMLGQYRKALGAGAPFRCDDLLPLLRTASSPNEAIEAFGIMSRYGLVPTMTFLRAASRALPSRGPSTLQMLLSQSGIEASLRSLNGIDQADQHAHEIVPHFLRFLEPSEFYRQAGIRTAIPTEQSAEHHVRPKASV
jgi:Pentapeptide repeats (8 copies)